MRSDGYNPMRHHCEADGCFIRQCRHKSEWFASIFPGKISFSDLDRIVEIAGRGLVFEWKHKIVPISSGQDIMWRRLTRGKLISVLCAAGDVSEMEIVAYANYFDGEFHDWVPCTLIEFTLKVRRWKEWALKNPLIVGFANDEGEEV